MKANEMKIQELISQPRTQFVIPIYQRNYDWNISQCKQLYNDIIDIGKDNQRNVHFIGSIVYVHDDLYSAASIKELVVIDGQQRLTTITLIYLAIFNHAKITNNQNLMNEVSETYLINKFSSDIDKFKLHPTENNKKALKNIFISDGRDSFDGHSNILTNYKYFRGLINENTLPTIQNGLLKLMVVEISLDRMRDNPQRIFESLNSTGLELSQSDLIRNYILMGLDRNQQNTIFNKFWEEIEKLAKDENLNKSKVSDFIRDYLTLENRKIPNKDKVYDEFKIKFPSFTYENLSLTLKKIKELAVHYNKLLNPIREQNLKIRLQLEYISRLEINVAFPFLLKVYDDFSKSVITEEIFLEILELIQSFVWRRFLLGLPTNALNKIFMNLYEKVDISDYVISIQKALLQKSGNQRFPKDPEVREALKSKDVYNIKSKNRVYFLDRLENHDNNEMVIIEGNQGITIEHIFPQNPDSRWKRDLGTEEVKNISENYLNTIANLTLSGNNGKLSNKVFLEKRDLPGGGYKESRLWLNKYLSRIEKWTSKELDKRFEILIKRFFDIWKYPPIIIDEDFEHDEINIFDADDPTHKKLDYAIFIDQKIELRDVTGLYVSVLQKLYDINPDAFFTTEIGRKINLTKDLTVDQLRVPHKLDDTYYFETSLSNIIKFDRLKFVLSSFNMEDELFIKFSKEEE